jgi:hypothetical protein
MAKEASREPALGRVLVVTSDSTEPTLRALACLPKAAVRDTQRMINVATPERAEQIAARWPDAQRWGMEIRALMHSGGEED